MFQIERQTAIFSMVFDIFRVRKIQQASEKSIDGSQEPLHPPQVISMLILWLYLENTMHQDSDDTILIATSSSKITILQILMTNNNGYNSLTF